MKRPDRRDVRVFGSAAEFRRWLDAHHSTYSEAWVGLYRKAAGKSSLTYEEAVDEALCFGWIDGITYGIDWELRAQRFTPRTKRSNWSAVNVRKVAELTAAGRMHPAGMAAFEARAPERTGVYSYENRPADLPPDYAERLQSNGGAWKWWRAQSPSYRRGATWWVVSARQDATRLRRLDQLVADCAAGRPIKPLAYGASRSRKGRIDG